MDVRRSNKLPEGVGKKIVEALKKQSEAISEVRTEEQASFNEALEFAETVNTNEVPVSYLDAETEDVYWNSQDSEEKPYVAYEPQSKGFDDDDFSLDSGVNDNYSSTEVEEFSYQQEETEEPSGFEAYEFYETSQANKEDEEEMIQEKTFTNQAYKDEEEDLDDFLPRQRQYSTEASYAAPAYEPPVQKQRITKPVREEIMAVKKPETEPLTLELSTNVDVLMKLISKLPPGVTRQTGAQIIRQTMEAMGVSMNKVLAEAQQGQDELGHSIRDNMNTIEEYKNNIRILEKEVQKYKKHSDALEDLISLFILSEKDLRK